MNTGVNGRPITTFRRAGTLALTLASLASHGVHADEAGSQSAPDRSALRERVVWTQVPAARADAVGALDAHDAVEAALPAGSRIVLLDPSTDPTGVVNLTPDFVSAGRIDLSFDGQRFLFIGRKTLSEHFAVWEMDLDARRPRRVTQAEAHCERAIYLSTLYAMDMDQPVHQIAFQRAPAPSRAAAIYTCRLDGTNVRRITFSPQPTTDPLLLSDGRLVFSSWSIATNGSAQSGGLVADPPDSKGLLQSTGLLSVLVDGTGLFPFAAMHESPAIRTMPCETPDGLIVYVESDGARGDSGGRLVAVQRTRSLRTRRVIADDPDGFYHSPSPVSDGKLVVSYRSKAGGSYGIYLFDYNSNAHGPGIYDDTAWHDVGARVVRLRPEPAGRSSVVKQDVRVGRLYCLDAYLSDRNVPRGEIKKLRVMTGDVAMRNLPAEQTARDAADDAGELKTRLTNSVSVEVPVEADGSFFLEVPARTPLRLETLDVKGNVLRTMRGWFWVMPNERRGCIGCHEDRELTPPNRHVTALRRAPWRLGHTPDAASPRSTQAGVKGADPK